MGRVQLDKDAVGQTRIVNDKDLRRQQLANGEAVCSIDDANRGWQKPHAIIMQIGDNIEDFAGVTQESADVNALSTKTGTSLFILPNPMYGSW
jgi:predicted secreted acid phosphatase